MTHPTHLKHLTQPASPDVVPDDGPDTRIHRAPAQSPRKKKPAAGSAVAKPARPAIPGVDPTEVPSRRGHTLDFAPVNTKIVVVAVAPDPAHPGVDRKAVIAGPGITSHFLPEGDIAHRLPVGALIAKVGDGTIRSEQLSPQVDHAPVEYSGAIAAIETFMQTFHSY